MQAAERHLDQTPERPTSPVSAPTVVLRAVVDVEGVQLANPAVAVSRLLASEAEALARVVGDERRLVVEVALANLEARSIDTAERWVRWVVHNAGVRGRVSFEAVAGAPPASRAQREPPGTDEPCVA